MTTDTPVAPTADTQPRAASRTPSRTRRPHPAQRARRIAGAVTVATMLVLTGGIAAATNRSGGATTAAVSTVQYGGELDDAPVATSQRSSVVGAAVAGPAAIRSNTATRAS